MKNLIKIVVAGLVVASTTAQVEAKQDYLREFLFQQADFIITSKPEDLKQVLRSVVKKMKHDGTETNHDLTLAKYLRKDLYNSAVADEIVLFEQTISSYDKEISTDYPTVTAIMEKCLLNSGNQDCLQKKDMLIEKIKEARADLQEKLNDVKKAHQPVEVAIVEQK